MAGRTRHNRPESHPSLPASPLIDDAFDARFAKLADGYTLGRLNSGGWVLISYIDLPEAIDVTDELARQLSQSGRVKALEERLGGVSDELGLYGYDDERLAAAAAT